MRMLVTLPDTRRLGGVSSFHHNLRPHLSPFADYFFVGSRPAERGVPQRARRLLADYARFRTTLRSSAYDLVFLNPSFLRWHMLREGLFLLLAKRAGARVLVFVHGWDEAYVSALHGLELRLFGALYSSADAFVVLARGFASRLRALGISAPVFLGTTAVGEDDLLVVEPAYRTHTAAPFRVLFLSRVEEGKGIFIALDAFAALKRRHECAQLVVVGDGGALAPARLRASSLGARDVLFAGPLEGAAKREALASAHCYLLPSYSEGMPISLLEAMAAGLPVITRPVGGIKDFFEDGRMGWLTSATDPGSFAGLLERLVQDPAACLAQGRHNREYARERFAPSAVAHRLLTIVEGVCGAG